MAKNWDPFKELGRFSFGGIFSWLKDIAMTIIMILLFLLFLYACFKLVMCITARATRTPDFNMYYKKANYVIVERK